MSKGNLRLKGEEAKKHMNHMISLVIDSIQAAPTKPQSNLKSCVSSALPVFDSSGVCIPLSLSHSYLEVTFC
jgi:hypothetical protein